MLRHLIHNATYKTTCPSGARHYRVDASGGSAILVEYELPGAPVRPLTEMTDAEWATIDFVGEPPLLEGRQYLVKVLGKWHLATWCVSRTRVDMPTQYFFHGWGVPFGALIETTVLVPLPSDKSAWLPVSIPDSLPNPGEEVLHVDRGEQFARSSVYDHYRSHRVQGLNGLMFGSDNPAQAVCKWLPIAALIAA